MTQPMLAKALGCSQASISDLMRGRTREPRYSIGQHLLTLAGHPVAALASTTDIEPAAAGQGV